MYGGYLTPTPLDKAVPDYFNAWLEEAREQQRRSMKSKQETVELTSFSVEMKDDPQAWGAWLDYIATVLDGEG